MNDSKIFVAGHRGMVGSSLLKQLKNKGYTNLVTRTRHQLNLVDSRSVKNFFESQKFDAVIVCAAKVGGILANNTYRADFIFDNLQIASNLIHSAHTSGVKKLINLGSSCIYPKDSQIPIKEEYLLSGKLEYTNEPYAIAKIAAIKMCESFYKQHGDDFYSIMPCNLYGPRDNFDLKSSHVLPALINKIHLAKERENNSIEVWGTGAPLREFLYVEDLASAVIHCLENVSSEDIYSQDISHLNCGSEEELSILELVKLIKKIIRYEGNIVWDKSKPDGTYRKKMDNTRMTNLGFSPSTSLEIGISKTYNWYLKNEK